MTPFQRVTLLGALLIPLPTVPLAAQALRGVVVEEGTNRPIAGATVLLERTNHETLTDEEGRFFLAGLPSGSRLLLIRSIGHVPLRMPVTLSRRDTASVTVTLSAAAVQLDSVLVEERTPPADPRMAAFEARREMGFGSHFDSEFLRRRDGQRLSEMLRQADGLRIVPFRERRPDGRVVPLTQMRAATARRQGLDDTPCYMSVYVDGMPVYRNEGGRSFGDPPDFSRDFQITNFDAIEVYASGAIVPVEFGGRGAECGIILLWSRRPR